MASRPPAAGRYVKIARLGGGGMGEVWAAVARGPAGFQKLAALKELLPALSSRPEIIARFFDEARLTGRFTHPAIVQTLEVGTQDGRLFLAMEYLEGQTLQRVLQRFGTTFPLPLGLHLSVLLEVLSALHYAHEFSDYDERRLGIVHRDVTPSNVILTYDGRVKLLDFGIATALGSTAAQRLGGVHGKPAYMSPEQALGEPTDRRTDIYAVGVMLWEALAGRRLFQGLDADTILAKVVAGERPTLEQPRAEATQELTELAELALARDPEQRPATALTMREALAKAVKQAGLTTDLAELGPAVSEAFTSERRELGDLIREALRDLRSDPPGYEPTPSAALTPLGDAAGTPSPVPKRDSDDTPTVRPPSRGRKRRRAALSVVGAGGLLLVTAALVLGYSASRRIPPTAAASPEGAAAQVPAKRCAQPNEPAIDITGSIEKDARLSCEHLYRLRNMVFVEPGATLTIDKGTTIHGDRATHGTLVVKPGARLLAAGTPDQPIVFTSDAPPGVRRAGDWGGVLLLGNAPTNLRAEGGRPARGQVEGLTLGGDYGGNNPDDDSGVLEYVRIEYGGVELAPGNEINGLTLAGVGRGTTIDHVQVRHVTDDCFEFFGGTVNAKHLICQYNADDGFDWDLGYRGKLQFLVLQQDPKVADATNGFEGDNSPGATLDEPRSSPQIYNATLCGKNVEVPHEQYGMLIRRGSHATIANVIVTGFEAGLDLADASTTLELRSVFMFKNLVHDVAYPEGSGDGPLRDDDGGRDERALFADGGARNSTRDLGLSRCFDPVRPSFAPDRPESNLAAAPPDDGFFDPTAKFVGAVRDASDAWPTAPWTVWSAE